MLLIVRCDNIVICVIDDFDIHCKDWFIFENDYLLFLIFFLNFLHQSNIRGDK